MATHHLSSGRLNIGCLRELARKELFQSLDKCHGTKALVWDEKLIGPFGLIAEYSLLKDHDVIKMYPMNIYKTGQQEQVNVQHIIFLVRPQVSLMDLIADNLLIEEHRQGLPKKDYHIFFVPRKGLLCVKQLKHRGVYGDFRNVEEINIELYPHDYDLMSMELPMSFHDCHLEGDMTSMYHVAKSLMTLQLLFGVIPQIYGKGKCAKHVYDLMVRMWHETSGKELLRIPSQIDALLLIDREVDLLSPLVTQMTYEGLIDEKFGINCTMVQLPPTRSSTREGISQDMSESPKKVFLNSGDEMYAELRKCNVSAVGPLLSRKAKAISAQFEERHGAKTISEIKQFVSKLPNMQAAKQSLVTHMEIAELIKEMTDSDDFLETLQLEHEFLNAIDTDKGSPYIEECIAKQESLDKVLRLICLQSVTNSGLKSKLLDHYKREILQTYGYQHLLTLQNLEAVGLLKVQDQRPYLVLRKVLHLTETPLDIQNPTDISFVHNGYSPISIRLAQTLARSGWKTVSDGLRLLPGPTIEEAQPIPLGLRKRRGSGSSVQSSTEDQKVTLVFFLGGCTYAEIAALRFLSQQEDYPTEYVIATTSIINGRTYLESLTEPLPPHRDVSGAS